LAKWFIKNFVSKYTNIGEEVTEKMRFMVGILEYLYVLMRLRRVRTKFTDGLNISKN